jgi:hypothetical protein
MVYGLVSICTTD